MEMKGRIVIYYVPGCPHCKQAKSTLDNLKLAHIGVDLEKHPELQEKVRDRTSKTSVPQIFFNNIHVGGNDDLQTLISDSSRWEAMLQEILENEPPENSDLEIPEYTDGEQEDQHNDIEIDVYKGHEEQNEHAAIVKEFRSSEIFTKSFLNFLSRNKARFYGLDLVKWIQQTKNMDEKYAKELASKLIDEYFFVCVKSAECKFVALYKFPEDSYMNALNSGSSSAFEYPAVKLAENLRKLILGIYTKFLSPDGKSVDYAGISGSRDFEEYSKLSVFLQKADVTHLSREEKIAFFINIYNAMVIHANVSVSVPRNMLQRYKFFNCNHYIIGGHLYSLQDMENGVLRGNKKGVGMLTRPFGNNDERLKVALMTCDPRVHFALVCGAKSCPPIKTYSPTNIDSELEAATQSFLENDEAIELNREKNQVHLSQIFKWYKEDFGKTTEEVLRWIHVHMFEGDKKNALGEIIQAKNRRISYQHYDWSINSK